MPNRRLSATLVLLASALLEVALRLRKRPCMHGRGRPLALGWLVALATVAGAATSRPPDAPP
ncbi:MAG TPA: hypothetical protein VF453_16740, partial [Burkholderiaceae bacterium]